jgi:hypothetical protein
VPKDQKLVAQDQLGIVLNARSALRDEGPLRIVVADDQVLVAIQGPE